MTATPTMSNAEIEDLTCRIVAESLGRPVSEIQLTSVLMSDLGAESLDYLDIVFRLEREWIGAVQLRYRFGGEEWWDTLTHTAAGVRLIRISHTRALAGSPDHG